MVQWCLHSKASAEEQDMRENEWETQSGCLAGVSRKIKKAVKGCRCRVGVLRGKTIFDNLKDSESSSGKHTEVPFTCRWTQTFMKEDKKHLSSRE